jgi:hypothetical protein
VRAGEPIELVDHHGADLAGVDPVEQGAELRSVEAFAALGSVDQDLGKR